MVFACFLVFLVCLRLGELVWARRNEKWLLNHGAIEYGRKHYPFIVALHSAFIVSLIVEYSVQEQHEMLPGLLVFYAALLAFKAWVILTLGYFWTTRIYHISRAPLVNTGPYKYFKHPNYAIVIAEIAVIPLAFHLYYTAIAFSLLNGVMLTVRIKEENRVLLL